MTPLSVLSSVLYCFIISRFQCQWVRDVYPHFGRCFFNFDQLALTAGCHLPCLTTQWPSGSLPHRSWYRPWPGSSRWANCYPRLPPGDPWLSIDVHPPAMAVEICGGTIKPIILDLSARVPAKIRSM